MSFVKEIEYVRPGTNDKYYSETGDTRVRILNDRGNYYVVNFNPTANCQLFLIKWAEMLLDNIPRDLILKEFKSAADLSGKRLCLIDVSNYYRDKVREVFGNNVVMESPYVSTNGSDMCIMLLKIRNAYN